MALRYLAPTMMQSFVQNQKNPGNGELSLKGVHERVREWIASLASIVSEQPSRFASSEDSMLDSSCKQVDLSFELSPKEARGNMSLGALCAFLGRCYPGSGVSQTDRKSTRLNSSHT